MVDTNLVFSGLIIPKGNPYRLRQALRRGRFTLLLSEPVWQEYQRVLRESRALRRYPVRQQDVEELLLLLRAGALMVVPAATVPVVVRDPHDEKVLAAALGGGADYLVTGDDDLLVLDGRPELADVRIVRVTEFLEVIDAPER